MNMEMEEVTALGNSERRAEAQLYVLSTTHMDDVALSTTGQQITLNSRLESHITGDQQGQATACNCLDIVHCSCIHMDLEEETECLILTGKSGLLGVV